MVFHYEGSSFIQFARVQNYVMMISLKFIMIASFSYREDKY